MGAGRWYIGRRNDRLLDSESTLRCIYHLVDDGILGSDPSIQAGSGLRCGRYRGRALDISGELVPNLGVRHHVEMTYTSQNCS